MVDDTAVPRMLLADMLRLAGMVVIEADSGEQALRLAGEHPIDAFLLDIRLPDMNGIELCRALRAMPAHKSVPIVFVSAMDQREMLQWALEAGCDDFIQKPIHAMVLRKRLGNLLQKSEYLAQVEAMGVSLRRYVSPKAEESARIYATTRTLPAPKPKQVCVMFCDTRGFLGGGRETDPAQLFERLSGYLEAQGNLVYSRGGYIDRFSSDGIMAVFEGEAAVHEACLCALDILDMSRERAAREGAGAIGLGIGLHKGLAVSGNLGTREHVDYTLVGATVNLAARLCGLAEDSVVVTQAVRDAAGGAPDLEFRGGREAAIRGFAGPVTVYDLVRGEP